VSWIPIAAWGAAVVVALVILGFCAYEIVWKAARLRRDVSRLQSLAEQMHELQGQVAEARRRVAASGLR
jgi:TRAP-type C4-dicarboxylate transport system permease small subunit